MLRCKTSELSGVATMLMVADITPIFWGPSAIGKTAIIGSDIVPLLSRHYGEEINLHAWQGAGMDERDSYGIPIIDAARKKTTFSQPGIVPDEDGKRHLILIDDMGHMSKSAQQPLYSMLHGKKIGGYRFPEKTHFILASNRKADGGGDNAMLRPLAKRVAHIDVYLDNKGWLEWAKVTGGFDPVLVSFLTLCQDWIYKDDPESLSSTNPRTLEMANRVIKANSLKDAERGIVAICGEGFARAFAQFATDCGAALPKLADIKNSPETAKVPAETHHQYLIAKAISEHMDAQNAHIWAKYLKRLSPDLASMCAKDAETRDSALVGHDVIKDLRIS